MDGKIFEAIANVMKDVGVVSKGDSNDFDHYKYRGIDAVMNALNPAMVKHHVFVTPTVIDSSREERTGKNGTSMVYSILTVKYTFYTDDGSSVECVVIGEAMDRSDKSTNKAMSAAFKYACFQTFCIPTEEMIDSESESPEIPTEKKKPTAPKKIEKEKTIKSDEQKNEEMKASVNPLLVPDGKGMTQERLDFLYKEIERTGIADSVLLGYAGAQKYEDMSEAKYIALMNRLAKTKDKEVKAEA